MDDVKPGELGETSAPIAPTEPVLDRGLTAWLQVLGSFMIFFSAGGMSSAYAAYQAFYLSPDGLSESASAISWIGSTQTFLLFGLNIVSGPLYDRGYYRPLLWAGSFFLVFGQLMLSLATSYYQVFLAQGLCMGLGGGLIFSPGMTVVTGYFDRRLEIAVGIVSAGNSVGGVVLPIVVNQAIPLIGFPWASRVLALVLFVPLCIAILVSRPLPPPRRRPSTLRKSWPTIHEPAYIVFLVGILLLTAVIFIPSFYLQVYGSMVLSLPASLANYLLSIFVALNAVGSVCLNSLATYLGPFNVFSLAVLISGALAFTLVDLHSSAGLLGYTVPAGFFTASANALSPACFMALSPSPDVVGTRVGIGYASMAVGGLVGPPIAGALLDRYGFDPMWVFAGVGSIAGAGIVAVSRGIHGGFRLGVKV